MDGVIKSISFQQHYLTMFGSTLSIPFFLMPKLCIEDDDPSRGYIISTMFYVSGLITLLQTTFGNRYLKFTRIKTVKNPKNT